MQVNIEEVSPCRNRVQITVPADKVTETFSRHYKDLRGSVRIKGFRQGKVPMSFLEKKFGDEISNQVKVDLIEESLGQALDDNDLQPIIEPEVDLGKVLVERDQDLSFEAFVEVRPTFELGDYDGLKIDTPDASVSDEEVDQEIEALRGRHATLEPYDGTDITDDDVLEARVSVVVEGEHVVKDEDIMIGKGTTTAAGIIVESLREECVKAGIGGDARFEVEIPRFFPQEQFRGKKGNMVVNVEEAKRMVLPELDDEFAKTLQLDTVDALKSKMREMIEARKQEEAQAAVEDQIIEKVLENTPFSIPEGLLKKETDRILSRARLQMEFQGRTKDEIDEEIAKAADQQQADVERSIKASFLLDAIAKKEKIFVTEDEVGRHLDHIAAREGRSPEEVRAHYEQRDMMGEVRFHLREAKTRAVLREKNA